MGSHETGAALTVEVEFEPWVALDVMAAGLDHIDLVIAFSLYHAARQWIFDRSPDKFTILGGVALLYTHYWVLLVSCGLGRRGLAFSRSFKPGNRAAPLFL